MKISALSLQSVLPDLIYYDADTINIKNNLNTFEFDGDAAFMMGDLFLSADKIVIQKSENFVTAEGNVKIIYKKTQATASKMFYDATTKQMRMDNAKIYSDPKSTDNTFEREALGLTKAEVAFDVSKKTRTQRIRENLQNLRMEYAKQKNLESINKTDQTIQNKIKKLQLDYSELLKRYNRIISQPNAYFAALPEDLKTKYIERREVLEKFNKEHPDMAQKILDFSAMPSYIFISAAQILQKNDNTYQLNNSFITPCNCGFTSVPPIIGFSAQKTTLDVGNYATMEGLTFNVFSLPIFYLPWGVLSIKDKRQSGFLYPSGYLSNNAGFAITFPFFLTLGDHADATTTYQYFSQRGSRISEGLRIAFLENSLLYMGGNTAFDKIYNSEWAENKAKIDTALSSTTDPDTIRELNNFTGTKHSVRWYGETRLNAPLSEDVSVKVNGQAVSDNTYIFQFDTSTEIDPMSTVYGNTTPASRRFLHQTVDAEYYGNHISLSARNARYQDLFAFSQDEAPIVLPLVEFTLFPIKFGKLPLYVSNQTSFEDIIVSQTIRGQRLGSSLSATLKLPENSYMTSFLEVKETAVQYYNPTNTGVVGGDSNPYEFFTTILFHNEIPFYGTSVIKNKEKEQETILKSNFNPFLEVNYTPVVSRSKGFPTTYNLWYAADNKARSAFVSLGASWSLNIRRFKLNSRLKLSNNYPLPTRIADTEILQTVLQKHQDIDPHPADEMLFLRTDTEATEIYMQWAILELTRYYDAVEKSEFNKTNLIQEVSDNATLDFTPLRLRLYTNYNIMADRTATELNQIAGPDFSPIYLPEPIGDLSAELDADLLPFVGWKAAVLYSYSFVYSRLNTLTASTNLSLGWGFAGLARYQILYNVDPQSPVSPTFLMSNQFVRKTFLNFGLSYTPVSYVKLGFEWAKNTDPQSTAPTTDLSNGRAYGSSFYINFYNLQDCMDIFVARNKPAGYPEGQATYSIGINVKFFGHEVRFNQLGNYINQKLQN